MMFDVACPFCSCVCDDLSIDVVEGQLIPQQHVCARAAQAYAAINRAPHIDAWQDGKPCEFETALQTAAKLLQNSRAPLLLGMHGMGTNSHRAAIQLAERLGGTIDAAGSTLSRATLRAFQQVGLSTCSLGEVKQRADLIIIWGADPMTTHTRLLERLDVKTGQRHLLVIDSHTTATSAMADEFLQIKSDSDFELILALRQLVRDESATPDVDCELSLAQLQSLSNKLKSCRYGTLFFGPGLARGSTPHLTVEMLYRLVSELNGYTRFTARALGKSGADNVLAWQTGYAGTVTFRHGYPEPLTDDSAESLRANGDVDCCIIFGTNAINELSEAALKAFSSLPTIVFQPIGETCSITATVQIAVAVDGVHASDTIYRFDDIPLPLRQLTTTDKPTVAAVVENIVKKFPVAANG
ncbi:molybdopterin-dependent oxidoreductase [Planctomicrobium piriforme]|uniref:Formylmethanofuran dehydrogenase subunit B n=1 Tax=Planctomicrobium piriforme TaxID=1576369 RepID=A0A1I3RIY5_9PLAN|nr:molybdopterin-dependent oxidoreductase [Planctomicrobium piriforme]SFJ46228.1 formylmethanofuran dehydrogenase subunit B [Planctomicrobium piriforme]